MKIRRAAVRALRTLGQNTLAVFTVFFLAIKGDGTFVNIKAHGAVLAYGFALAFGGAVISFGQNLLEDNTPITVPK